MTNRLFVFGDSWAWGSELKDPTSERFSKILSGKLELEEVNFARPGSSLFEINYRVLDETPENSSVIVIIPPDSRISVIKKNFQWETVDYNASNYKNYCKGFVTHNDADYFRWYHNQLIDSICHNLHFHQNKFLLVKNYGQLDLLQINSKWKKNIMEDSLHDLLLEHRSSFNDLIYVDDFDRWSGPHGKDFSGKYFEGCKCHPNKLGHLKIAEIIEEEIKKL